MGIQCCGGCYVVEFFGHIRWFTLYLERDIKYIVRLVFCKCTRTIIDAGTLFDAGCLNVLEKTYRYIFSHPDCLLLINGTASLHIRQS